jgi:calcium binding protein 39
MPTGLFDIRKLVKETKKTPGEVVQKALVALQALATDGPNKEKEQASIHKYLGFMKLWLFRDEQGHGPTRDKVIALAHEVVGTDLQLLIVQNIALLDFETRKDAALVFGAIVRIKDQNDTCPGAMYVKEHPQILSLLFKG